MCLCEMVVSGSSLLLLFTSFIFSCMVFLDHCMLRSLFVFQMHNGYVFKYWFCELLCFINIVGQLFLVDRFLGGEFLTYGPRVRGLLYFLSLYMYVIAHVTPWSTWRGFNSISSKFKQTEMAWWTGYKQNKVVVMRCRSKNGIPTGYKSQSVWGIRLLQMLNICASLN